MQPVGYSAEPPFCKRLLSMKGQSSPSTLRRGLNSALTSTKGLQGMLSSHKFALSVDPGLIPQRQRFDLVRQLMAQLLKAPPQ